MTNQQTRFFIFPLLFFVCIKKKYMLYQLLSKTAFAELLMLLTRTIATISVECISFILLIEIEFLTKIVYGENFTFQHFKFILRANFQK